MFNNICPFNFEKFMNLNAEIGNIEACLLLSKIKFHQQFSSYTDNNKTWAILTRKQIASWFGFSLDKTDKLLNLLVSKGYISKQAKLWYGVKKLIITVDPNAECPAINFNLLNDLIDRAGSVKAALLFCHISFRFANSIIKHKDSTWCCINKDTLANWSNASIRTIDSMLKILIQKDLINKSLFSWNNKPQTHFNIPNAVIETLQKHWEKIKVTPKPSKHINSPVHSAVSQGLIKLKPANQHFCRSQPAKIPLSIIENTNTKKNNNNTCDINFSKTKLNVIGNKLTYRQTQYLKGAINNIKLRCNIKISNPEEFEEWVKFSILEETQRKGITDFKHAVSRFMKIIADNKYNMPIGFNKHSEYGIKAMEHKRDKEQHWQELKKIEIQSSKPIEFNNVLQDQSNFTEQALAIAKKMAELSKVDMESSPDNAIINMINKYNVELRKLMGQGADVKVVKEYLQKNILYKYNTINKVDKVA